MVLKKSVPNVRFYLTKEKSIKRFILDHNLKQSGKQNLEANLI